MLRNWKKLLAGAALFAALPWLAGFSLYGPGGAEGIAAKSWQLPAANAGWDIGYNIAGLDIGAPVAADEAYRWNIPEITYGFDEAFMRFFGTNGVKEIDKAIRIFNELPPVSRMSADLSEFPLNTTHLNYEAAQLGLIDRSQSHSACWWSTWDWAIPSDGFMRCANASIFRASAFTAS